MKTPLLSILALYNWDTKIFDNLLLPVGVDKEDVTNNLLMELAELEIIYPNWDTMKAAIGFWSKKELPVWNKLFTTTQLEYNPLENAYRTETTNNTETRNLSATNNETRNLTGAETHESDTTGTTTNSGTDTEKEYTSGFNEATPTLAKQVEQTLGQGNTVIGAVDSLTTKTDGGTVNNSATDTGTVNTVNNYSLKGSIGIITPQQMVEQERKVSEFNIVDYIIDSFKMRFCILVY